MYYDGVLGYKFTEMYDDPTVYEDSARRVVSLTSESANGMCEGSSVVVYYALKDDLPMIICERVAVFECDSKLVTRRVEIFNNINQHGMMAAIHSTETGEYCDIVVSRIDMYNTLKEM